MNKNTIALTLAAACLGALFTNALSVNAQKAQNALPVKSAVTGSDLPFTIVDTPGSTYLLNQGSGQVWRLGFTEVRGDRYWFGTHVPVQPPGTFDEFQESLRQRLAPQKH
ncbi:MAG: hypothetical protein GY822_03210 [Deltaproteobacteria bacterium]|nr:hypothetical protein [Deltaproteobacteria bacterium]